MPHSKEKVPHPPSDNCPSGSNICAEGRSERRDKVVPSVKLDLCGFLTELREWIEAVEAGNWDTASERLRDACDEAYCLESWKEFTNRLGTSNMEYFVPHLKRFLVAVETTARSISTRDEWARPSSEPSRPRSSSDDDSPPP